MLTLVFGMPVSRGKVNRSLDLCLIAKETTGDCEHGFVYKVQNTKNGTSALAFNMGTICNGWAVRFSTAIGILNH